MTKTKIICTMSEKLKNRELLKDLINNGMNIVRLNFSHLNHNDAKYFIDEIRYLRRELNTHVAIMGDTKGPENRLLGYSSSILLQKGETIKIFSSDQLFEQNEHHFCCSCNLPYFPEGILPNHRVLFMDGKLEGRVLQYSENELLVQISEDILLLPKAHFSIPGTNYPIAFLTKKDIEDIQFSVQENIEYLALSFVRCTDDIMQVRSLISHCKPESQIRIITKLELQQALDSAENLIKVSDGLLFARGDLGVETDFESLPIKQKKMNLLCQKASKPFIIATQLLDSMITANNPTRAEISDISNSVYDFCSCLTLSGETAIGNHPLLSLNTMKRIVDCTEEAIDYQMLTTQKGLNDLCFMADAIKIGQRINAEGIILISNSYDVVACLSSIPSSMTYYAITDNVLCSNQFVLLWNVVPQYFDDLSLDLEFIVKSLKSRLNIAKNKKWLLLFNSYNHFYVQPDTIRILDV